MSIALKLKNISKMYRLGVISSSTLSEDLKRFWFKIRGKEDPFLTIGEENKRSEKGGKYVWALKDINLTIDQGEVVGIIGKNGAGKSTLLKLLSKVTRPTTGEIITRGKTSSLLEVGTGFHQELTGRENIFLNGAILGMTKAEIDIKIDEIIEFSGCQKYIDTPVKRYSSGMFVRLAFAVAAYLEPDILIVDEVLAVGDIEFQKKAIGKMQDISKKGGRTVLFVSHNMTSIKSLCTRAILLKNGSIIGDGTAYEVVNTYLSDGADNNNVRLWTSNKPTNGEIELCSLKIYNPKNKIISIDDDFIVEASFKVIKTEARVGLNFTIHDSEQNYLLSSLNNHESNFYGKKMALGTYKSMCYFPGSFFNSGTFYLSINMFGQNFNNSYFEKYALKFILEDGIKVRGDYSGPYGGTIRPLLKWETKKV